MPPPVTSDDLAFLGRHALKTPVRASQKIDDQFQRKVFIKDETVQLSGSFKYRGAILGVRNAEAGVIAAGSGNFPIAVGLAAKALNKTARLIMPHDVPAFKLALARQTGAEIKFVDRSELVAVAEADASRLGWRNLHTFEDAEMIAGSYSLGLELAESIKSKDKRKDAVVVAYGGGGLSAGVSLALRDQSSGASIHVIEPESHQRYVQARLAGKPVRITPHGTTGCDALQARLIGQRAFDILERSDVTIDAVSDTDIPDAVDLLRINYGIRAEPSGALALAAVLEGKSQIWSSASGSSLAAATRHSTNGRGCRRSAFLLLNERGRQMRRNCVRLAAVSPVLRVSDP